MVTAVKRSPSALVCRAQQLVGMACLIFTFATAGSAGAAGTPSVANGSTAVVQRYVEVAPAETLAVQTTKDPKRASRGTVVLLPGPVGSAFALRHVTQSLAEQGFEVLVVDPLGMGASSRPQSADYALSAQARRVYKVLQQCIPDSARYAVAAVGTSATIALHLAAIDTRRVSGIVSVAGGGNDTQSTPGLRFALTFGRLLETSVGRAFGRRRFASTARDQSGDPSWVTNDAVSGYLRHVEQDVRGMFRVLKHMAESHETQPVQSRLPMIQAPVVLLVGDKPKVNAPTPAQIAVLANGLRQFRVDTLPGAGAMLHEERPRTIVQLLIDLSIPAHNGFTPVRAP